MKALALIASATVLAALPACEPVPTPQSSASPPVTDAAAIDLTGHYRLSDLGEGTALDDPIDVSASESAIWWEPECAGQGLSYRTVGPRQVEFFDPTPGEGQIVCEIGYPDDLASVWQALQGQHTVAIDADRSIRLGEGSEQIVLQPVTDPLPETLAGTWRVEEIDGLSTQDMRTMQFRADDGELWWEPRCAGLVLRYRLQGTSIDLGEAQTGPEPSPDPSASPRYRARFPSRPVCAIALPPYLDDARTALRAAEQIRRDNRNNIVLSGGGHYIVLAKL